MTDLADQHKDGTLHADPKHGANGANGKARSKEMPTADDPLRGLEHLRKVAVMGSQRLAELARKRIVYLWDQIAVQGTIVLLAGPPAEGKTTLLFLVLVARANLGQAVKLLGRFIEPAARGFWLVLIEGEHSEASTARKLVKSLRLLGIDESALERVIIIARKAVRLGSPEWRDIEKLVSCGLVSDIAIDTIARVAPANADDEKEQVAIFEAVARTIESAPDADHKPTVWAAAHTRKQKTGGLADVSGSAQRTGQADTVLLLEGEKVDGRTVSTKVVFQKLREDPDEYPLPVSFAITRDAVGAPALRILDVSDDDNRALEARIVEQLELGPKTANALSTALRRSGADVQVAISNLFSARAIRSTQVTVQGRNCKAFMLAPRARSTSDDEGES